MGRNSKFRHQAVYRVIIGLKLNEKGPRSAEPFEEGLHVWIIGPIAPLRNRPSDVLAGVFDVASFAMHAVLEIDLELRVSTFADKLIDTCGAIPR